MDLISIDPPEHGQPERRFRQLMIDEPAPGGGEFFAGKPGLIHGAVVLRRTVRIET